MDTQDQTGATDPKLIAGVQKMMDAGESEDAIRAAVQEYKQQQTTASAPGIVAPAFFPGPEEFVQRMGTAAVGGVKGLAKAAADAGLSVVEAAKFMNNPAQYIAQHPDFGSGAVDAIQHPIDTAQKVTDFATASPENFVRTVAPCIVGRGTPGVLADEAAPAAKVVLQTAKNGLQATSELPAIRVPAAALAAHPGAQKLVGAVGGGLIGAATGGGAIPEIVASGVGGIMGGAVGAGVGESAIGSVARHVAEHGYQPEYEAVISYADKNSSSVSQWLDNLKTIANRLVPEKLPGNVSIPPLEPIDGVNMPTGAGATILKNRLLREADTYKRQYDALSPEKQALVNEKVRPSSTPDISATKPFYNAAQVQSFLDQGRPVPQVGAPYSPNMTSQETALLLDQLSKVKK